MSFRKRGLWDKYDCDPDVSCFGKPDRRSGWKYDGIQENKAGLRAVFHYSVAILNIDGQYQEDPALSQTVMIPNRLSYTLLELEQLKAEKLFMISVPEKVMDQGIQGLRARIALEQAKAEAEAARDVVLEPGLAYEEELELKVA